jgi:uncharacterized membrane protein YgcG
MRFYNYILIFAIWCFSENAYADYFFIRDYNIDIKVLGKQGLFEVHEEITVEFNEPRKGIFRNIPYKYRINGEDVSIKIFDVYVEGYKFSTSTENNNYVIKIGDKDIFLDGIQKYKISYKVKKAFILTDEHTEFYWNLIGTGWPVSIDTINYTVKLDEATSMSENDYYVYTGKEGEKGQDATISYFVDKFVGHSTRPYGPNEGLTLAIKLPKEYIRRPSKEEILWEKYGMAGIGSILFLIISGLFYRTWHLYGKDYPIVRMVQFVPPPDLNPAEAGVLIDEKADNVDILALLPYWAHNGHITIKRIPVKWGKDDHEISRIKNLPENAGPYEKIIFDGLFADNDTVLISSLENSFYEYLQSAKLSLKTHLNNMGVYYPVSMKMQITTAIISVLLAFAGIGLGIIFQSFAIGIGLGLTSIVGLFFANYMLKKNERGVHLYQQVLGFKMFIKAAEKDKIERLLKEDPEYFEKTLPYAMVFGYAKQWSKKFDGLLLEPPKWYVAPHGMYYHGNTFSPSEFGSSFDSGIRDIQSVFTSMPASSGGGGGSFSGGGSSGGGFGGGGGGSW